MRIAYLVNQYPKVSHSFIRREITALETCGIEIFRYSIRSMAAQLIDEADKAELAKTRIVLSEGIRKLLFAFFRVSLTHPVRFLKALALTLEIGWNSDRGLLINLAYLVEACVLLEEYAKLEIQHVHAHFGINPTAVAMLCRVLGGPSYSFTVHGPEEFDKAEAIALTQKIERASFVVAVSSFGRSQLYRWCDRQHWSKIQVVRCGVDEMFLNQPHIPVPDNYQLVCVGRLDEQKGHLLLIEAAAQLAVEGWQFKLVLVGDGGLRSHIESLIAQHHLQEHVELVGWASSAEVQQHILNSRALVLPSFAEGLPVVLMEALALGRPVLSTYVAGIPELVQPEAYGWLVPPGSVEALVKALKTVLQTPIEVLEQMGRMGAARVAQQHHAASESQKLITLFRAEIERSPQSTSTASTPTVPSPSPYPIP